MHPIISYMEMHPKLACAVKVDSMGAKIHLTCRGNIVSHQFIVSLLVNSMKCSSSTHSCMET